MTKDGEMRVKETAARTRIEVKDQLVRQWGDKLDKIHSCDILKKYKTQKDIWNDEGYDYL